MKVAVIGAGRVGKIHAKVLARLGIDLVVHDENSRLSDELARTVDGRVAGSAGEALHFADAAVIATPPAAHAALVRAATELGRPVLCEKPLAESAASAEELADFVEQRGGLVQVGLQRRFDSGYAAVRDAIHDGDVGKLHLLRLTSTETGLAPSPKTNIFRNTAIHDFDLVRWLSADEVDSIYVQGGSRGDGPFDPRLDPDTIVATMRLARGALAVVTVSRLASAGYEARAEVLGSRDHLCTGMGPQSPIRFIDGFAKSNEIRPVWDSWQSRFADAFERQMSAFLAAVRGTEPCGATLNDAVQAQRLAEAARLSMEQDAPVHLDPGS